MKCPTGFRRASPFLAAAAILIALGTWHFSKRGTSPEGVVLSATPTNIPGAFVTSESVKPSAVQTLSPSSHLDDRLATLSADSVSRASQIGSLAASGSISEIQSTLDSLWDKTGAGPARELASELIRRWAREDPASAAAWILQKPAGPRRHESALAIATVWAASNASAAADWARQWPADEREAGIVAVAYETLRSAPEEALWLASELSAGATRDDLIAHAAREWTSASAEAPVEWAEKLDPSPLRDQVYTSIATALSETNPESAVRLAISRLPEGDQQNDAVISIVQRWAQQAPHNAVEWIERFPDGNLRNNAIMNLVQGWAEKNAEEAGHWVRELAPGGFRDAALSAYSKAVAADDPAAAVPWIESIEDPARRNRETEILGKRWIGADADAARAWIQTTTLDESTKQKLLAIEPPPALEE